MKVQVIEITYQKSRESKFGMAHDFKMEVLTTDGELLTGFYTTNDQGFNSESKTSKKFEPDKEANIEVHEMKSKAGNTWLKFKPEKPQANYSPSLKKEQARYSSFAFAYVKDLIIHDKVKIADWTKAAEKAAIGMMEIDRKLNDNS